MKVFYILLIAIQLMNCSAFRHYNRPNLQNRPIVGGIDAQITSFPYQVSLGYLRERVTTDDEGNTVNKTTYRHNCGGSIISVEWVLTAAHCVKIDPDDYERMSAFRVRVGSQINSEGGSLHEVARIVYHPGFDYKKLDQDVAVIKVKEPFVLGPTVQPIPLTKYPRVPGGIVTVSGWGSTTEYGDSPKKLQKVQLPIMPQWECRMHYRDKLITDNMFCAGRAGRSACHGDSGGPVVYSGVQVGIVSWGLSCQRPDYPAVYASVVNLRNWIHKYSGV